MSELSAAIRQLDAIARMLGDAAAGVRSASGTVAIDADAVRSAITRVHGLLGAAIPDSVSAVPQVLPQQHVSNLVELRRNVARLGAAAHAIEELGGVSHVVAQGGLDAIDGAAAVYQRHMADHLRGPLEHLRRTLDDGPGWKGMFDPAARHAHVDRVRDASFTVSGIGSRSGVVPDDAAGLVPQHSYYAPDRNTYRQMLAGAEELYGSTLRGIQEPGHREVGVPGLLRSGLAQAQVARQGIDVPATASLATVADDAELVAMAPEVLEAHARLLDQLGGRLGGLSGSSDEFRTGIAPFAGDFHRIRTDAERLLPLLADAPEAAQQHARSLADLMEQGAQYAAEASRGARPYGMTNLPTMFGRGSKLATDLSTQLRRILDDPSLARARLDVADEISEVLARPGELDTAALRSILGGEVPKAARAALVERFASTARALQAPARVATTADDALRRLDEADLLSEAVVSIARNTTSESYVYGLTEPGIREVIRDIGHRRASALGTADMVPQEIARELRRSSRSLLERLDGHDTATASYDRLGRSQLDHSTRTATAYRESLAELAARAERDGGLRTLPPSARRADANAAGARWIVRELDALVVPAADATSEQHVEAAARRLALLADLAESVEAGDPLARRIASDLQATGGRWRMPDDVSLRLQQLAGTPPDRLAAAHGTFANNAAAEQLREVVADLRAWIMLDDGVLPSTTVDRHAVGARRATEAAKFAARPVAPDQYSIDSIRTWANQVRLRVADVEATLGELTPPAELEAVHRSQFVLERHLDDFDQLREAYRTSEWTWNRELADAYRGTIADFARRIEADHLDARAALQAG